MTLGYTDVRSLRKTAFPSYPRAAELLAQNPYTPPAILAQAVMHASRLLTELIVVREWLHDTAPQPPAVDATTGYWKFTKHQVMQSLRMNKPASLNSMDPDAINREEPGTLTPDDIVSGTRTIFCATRLYMLDRTTRNLSHTHCTRIYVPDD